MKIKIYATSDVHGTITPYRYSDQKEANIGLMKLASYINKDETTLLIDNGDVLQGSPLDYVHHLQYENRVHPMAKCFNYLKYDYINLGNHEFNFGKDNVWKYLEDSNATCLTSNLFDGDKCFGQEYVLHKFDEKHTIALIGVTTQYIPNWEQPRNISNMIFEDAFETVKKTVEKIRINHQVSGIAVVYHGGFERNLETFEPTETLTGENLGVKMCREIEGIDLLISGHQHRSIAGFCNGVCVTQTAFNAQELAYIEWDLDTKELKPALLKADKEIKHEMLELFKDEEEATQIYLDKPLGKMKEGDLLIHDGFDARLHKHPLISFLNQVQKHVTGSDLAANALFNDAVGFNSEITMRDLVSTYVYPNTLVVLKVTGKILKEYIEKCAEYFAIKDGEIVVAENYLYPKPAHYNYDMIDGCEYTIQVSNPIGQRVIALTINGNVVQDEDIFTMSMNNYRAACGGNFFMLKDCEVVRTYTEDMVECLCDYILKHPVLEIDHKENITVIK